MRGECDMKSVIVKGLSYVICGIGGFAAGVALLKPQIKMQYHQGRLDALTDVQDEFIKIRDELSECREKLEEL